MKGLMFKNRGKWESKVKWPVNIKKLRPNFPKIHKKYCYNEQKCEG